MLITVPSTSTPIRSLLTEAQRSIVYKAKHMYVVAGTGNSFIENGLPATAAGSVALTSTPLELTTDNFNVISDGSAATIKVIAK